ncbi:hypothetical protein ACFQUU_15275 [Herbaspirillum sp. GCM10030257]|uniref:hypothetical protein n=1 Tax=Herbaspirillum sp. GCM10030257 TaxID=3273393 RepID=UPI00361B8308
MNDLIKSFVRLSKKQAVERYTNTAVGAGQHLTHEDRNKIRPITLYRTINNFRQGNIREFTDELPQKDPETASNGHRGKQTDCAII